MVYWEARRNSNSPPATAIKIMQTQIEENVIAKKTRELCQTILDQPDVRALRERIDAFMADDQTRGQYDALMVKGQMLQQKQQAGQPLDSAEVKAFEQLRDGFVNNPVARGFLDAQEDIQKLQQSVTQYLTRTFELGRVPEESEMESGGSCGHGCGCHH
jgi:cell fate (sporulation/competence/biofilm development) regulator YlbF (YheA/YmcA/DUF963 family)